MPTVDVNYEDLCMLIGKHIPIDKLKDEYIFFAKGEIESEDGINLKIDIKDTNRPDLWSVEGIAREIKFRLNPGKLPVYAAKKSGRKILVSKEIKSIRPCIAAAIIKNIKVTEELLVQMIHLQDKVDETFGRKRKEVAIGIYDYDKVKGNIKYIAADPIKTKFIPLEFEKELNLKEILKQHPKGKIYAHLINKYKKYPLLVDSENNVLSMPPIINSNYSGKVTEETTNLIVEVTGYKENYVHTALLVMVASLADRGGEIESLEIIYPNKKITTPDFTPKIASVDVDYIRKLLGQKITDNEIYNLLEKSGYEIKSKGKKLELFYPAYREDIMHQVDVIEDVIISYGYNKIKQEVPKLITVGGLEKITEFSNKAANIMVGLGSQEILSYTLTNKDNLFAKMNLPTEKIVEIENIVSANWCVFRNWLIPGLLDFLSKNKHVEYPQNIFEIGDVVVLDSKKDTKTKNFIKIASALTDYKIGYEQIASMLDAFLQNLNIKYKFKEIKHPSFISGRCAAVFVKNKKVGIVGEINPAVLENWKLKNPVACFELNLEEIFITKQY